MGAVLSFWHLASSMALGHKWHERILFGGPRRERSILIAKFPLGETILEGPLSRGINLSLIL